jgi:two-component system NtrC family sensor kinase
LDQQTATSEILRVIASSPTDVQPVFEAIVKSAVKLCGGLFGAVLTFDGELLHLVASYNLTPAALTAYRQIFPMPPRRVNVTGRAILERSVANIPDFDADPEVSSEFREAARLVGYRSIICVPMLRDGRPIGGINVAHREVDPFSDKQIALLQTFADQAVIAIENVRLFNETKEALEQQTATSDILRVISTSPTDLQPVLEAVAKSAARFCGADDAIILKLDGEHLRAAAHQGPIPVDFNVPIPCVPGTVGGRTVLERRAIHVTDLQAEAQEFPEGSALAKHFGHRTTLGGPLLREGTAIGTIQLRRREANRFTDKQAALLQTFADQAVIAIENVRLFKELETRNAQLTESLTQQTATSEILRVISSSPTDVHPVFATIARSAARLCDALASNVQRFDGELMHMVANHNWAPEGLELTRRLLPIRPSRSRGAGRAVLSRAVVHIPDVLEDPEYSPEPALAGGWRAVLSVPMLREDAPIGAITVTRAEAGPFSEAQIELLKTFADQAVIAIENVRLFNETKEALEQQAATSEILRVISGSPTDTQPVFEGIARSGVRVCGALGCAVFLIEDDVIRVAATHGVKKERLERFRTQFPAPVSAEPEFGRVIREGLFHLADIANNPEATAEQIEYARLAGYRTRLMVPMRRGPDVLGVIAVTREEASPFSDQQVELLKTFADQAVIAIENVRLFTELQASNRELTTALDTQTATSDILRVISHAQTDVQPVFDAILASAVRLLQGYSGVVTLVAGDQLDLVALTRTTDAGDAAVRALYPERLDSQATHVRATRNRAPLNIADAHSDPQLPEVEHTRARVRGYRSHVVVPLLRQDEAIGTIGVTRRDPGGFTDDEIALLQTFADQAVIAIENVRLFTELQASNREIADKSRQLEAASQHKSEFLANMSHELRTPLRKSTSKTSTPRGLTSCP